MATKEQMTVHKALAELKVIDSRINNAIRSGTFVVANKHSNDKIHGVTINEFKNSMKSDFQKVSDLIARRNAIKKAVVASNAVTKVKVGDTEYTVATAIEMKNHGMEFKNTFKKCLESQYAVAKNELDKNSGDPLEKRAENYVLSVIQAQPKDSKMAVDSEAMKNLRAQYIKDNTYDIIDPIGVKDSIEQLDNEISSFITEVDAALSVSNALTVLDIEY
jgi:hypothetical protein